MVLTPWDNAFRPFHIRLLEVVDILKTAEVLYVVSVMSFDATHISTRAEDRRQTGTYAPLWM